MPDLERLLPDVPATFPRPDPALTKRVRERVLRGRRPPRRRRPGIAAAAVVPLVATIGFTIGHWLVPARSVAATAVSIAARPTVLTAYKDPLTLYGALANGAAGQTVVVEARDCGSYGGFRVYGGAQTTTGGVWAIDPKKIYPLGITTVFRARWKDQVSDTATVRVRPQLFLQRLNGFFQLTIRANDIFRGDVGVVERRQGDRWTPVKRIVITGFGGYNQGGMARFHARLRRGTPIRVVLTQAQVGRCFLPGVSNIVRA